ncbi:MAG TPA: hypothetical protein VFQ81_04065 [Candidatus Limnocylindria bacterium]|jgi:hypothetical protein|nr:hypothetical protein [Candidatus Limnocylindria bacterium]
MNRAISQWGMHAMLRQEELLDEACRERIATNARRRQRSRLLGRMLSFGRRRAA